MARTRSGRHRRSARAWTRNADSGRQATVAACPFPRDCRVPGKSELEGEEQRRTDEAAAHQYEGRAKCPTAADEDDTQDAVDICGNSSSSWTGGMVRLGDIDSSIKSLAISVGRPREKISRNGGGRSSPRWAATAAASSTQSLGDKDSLKGRESRRCPGSGETMGGCGRDEDCRRSARDNRQDSSEERSERRCGEKWTRWKSRKNQTANGEKQRPRREER